MDTAEQSVEDILVMYAAGVMSHLDVGNHSCSKWLARAAQAACQLGIDVDEEHKLPHFGIPLLDQACQEGRYLAAERLPFPPLQQQDRDICEELS